MYTVPGQQKQWSSAQAGEHGVAFRARHPVLVKYKKSKLKKVVCDDAQLQANQVGGKVLTK